MEQLQSPSYEECVDQLKEVYEELEKIPNFYYADIGYKIVNGKETNEYAIRVYIHGPKTTESHEDSPYISQYYGSVKTDIVATNENNKRCPLPRKDRIEVVSPLIGGISIGPHDKVSTLGIVCQSNKYGLCALTTFHDNKLINKEVFQPSPQEGNDNYSLIGKIIDHDSEYDISLLKLNSADLIYSEILELVNPSIFASWKEIEHIHKEKIDVYKSGRTTAVTSGKISSLWEPSQRTTIKSNSQEVISCPGDSGAIWQTEEGQIIGVHTRGIANNLATCYSVNKLIDYWGISLIQIPT